MGMDKLPLVLDVELISALLTEQSPLVAAGPAPARSFHLHLRERKPVNGENRDFMGSDASKRLPLTHNDPASAAGLCCVSFAVLHSMGQPFICPELKTQSHSSCLGPKILELSGAAPTPWHCSEQCTHSPAFYNGFL